MVPAINKFPITQLNEIMTAPKINIEKTITVGNLIEMLIILVIAITAFTKVQISLDAVHNRQDDLENRLYHHQKKVEQTYVRKDVFDEILIRLESIDQHFQNQRSDGP